MFGKPSIRRKIVYCITFLMLIVSVMAFNGVRGVYAYRQLARDISQRASEQPLSDKLTWRVSQLRMTLTRNYSVLSSEFGNQSASHWEPSRYELSAMEEDFHNKLAAVKVSLDVYRSKVERLQSYGSSIIDTHGEREKIGEIESVIRRVEKLDEESNWVFGPVPLIELDAQLRKLHNLAYQLPQFLQRRMYSLADEVRIRYRTWIITTWVTGLMSTSLLIYLLWYFFVSLAKPFRTLIDGSRQVAAGNFRHRVHLTTDDEMSELAGAMNSMTNEFERIRDDLDQQVRDRTKEVVRSEQLAHVGFLAAGVAHEINNPMASIAWCAESLESRLHDIIVADDAKEDGEHNEEITVLRKYLRRIQDEAFRCKGITEQLLDFSRIGDVTRQRVDLRELVQGVIEMVQHLGKYRQKKITFACNKHVVAMGNEQEIKQVVLNLLTNACDSLEPNGQVHVELFGRGEEACLVVADNGCGMTWEVMQHLFDPFFTRRRDGQGTGLGLSITERIVTDHGGTIQASSDGPGRGSQFEVTFPLAIAGNNHDQKNTAA